MYNIVEIFEVEFFAIFAYNSRTLCRRRLSDPSYETAQWYLTFGVERVSIYLCVTEKYIFGKKKFRTLPRDMPYAKPQWNMNFGVEIVTICLCVAEIWLVKVKVVFQRYLRYFKARNATGTFLRVSGSDIKEKICKKKFVLFRHISTLLESRVCDEFFGKVRFLICII